MSELTVVGQSVKRLDALEKVTGTAKYVMDMKLPGMLYGKILRSPYPHAKIVSIDTSEAEKLPGVRGVVTAADFSPRLHGAGLSDEPSVARDRVRFVGEAVAAVAAETSDIAEEAVGLINVEYEELPAVFDAEEAMKPDPPAIVHPDLFDYYIAPVCPPRLDRDKPNVYNHYKIRHGDLEKGFQEADYIMENRFSVPMIQHCQFEPHVSIARVEMDGTYTVWSSTQSIYGVKQMLCEALDVTSSQVRMIVPYVGGGFGGKLEIKTEAISSMLAKKTRRPVKVAYTREDVFVSATVRHPMVVYLKDGVKKDGTIVARQVTMILNGGAYSEYGVLTVRNSTFGAVGSYKIPNFRLDSYGVYTNTPIGGAFRGFGNSQVIWAIEQHMDMWAEKLGMDPVEFRLKNILHEGDINVTGERTHSIGAEECLRKAAEAIGWPSQPKNENGPWKRGIGIALGQKYSVAPTASCAYVKVHDDDIIEIRTSADEIGQGSRTVLGQIAAEEFKVGMDKIRVVAGDTAFTPYDQGSLSSRTTYNTGNAVRLACKDAKRQIFTKAADRLEASPDDLETAGGSVYVKGSPERSLRISDLFSPTVLAAGKFLDEGCEFMGKDTWYQYATPEDPETGQGERLVAFYIHGAQGVEVAVNVETGEVRVEKIVGAFDMGIPINPKLCEGQIEAGFGMGIGSALYEEMVLDNGTVLNPTFMDYKIPTTMEIPSGKKAKSMIVEAPHSEGPFGAKGLGEGVMTPTAPSIANAVYNAVGVRIQDLSISREKVLNALNKKVQ